MKLISRQEIYNGRIIKVYDDLVELNNGGTTHREVVSHRYAAAVVAVTDDRKILMVRQYRHPVQRDLLEIPAGLIDDGETPLKAAKRELMEETGHEASTWHLLTAAFMSPGCHDEVIHIYAATGLRQVAGQSLDRDEILTFETLPYDDVLQMIKSGEIRDAKTIVGIMLFNNCCQI